MGTIHDPKIGNKYEAAVARLLIGRGYEVYNRGWPDFMVINPAERRGFCVEVKMPPDRLSATQIEMHKWLRLLGLPVYVIRADRIDEIKELAGGMGVLTRAEATSVAEKIERAIRDARRTVCKLETLGEQIGAAFQIIDEPRESDHEALKAMERYSSEMAQEPEDVA